MRSFHRLGIRKPRILHIVAFLQLCLIFLISYAIFVYSDQKYPVFAKPDRARAPSNKKLPVMLFIGIMSAPNKIFRRNALRRSWVSQCEHHNTACWFFTDAQDMYGKRLPDQVYLPLRQETYLHGDIVQVESPGGVNFARRYLWMITWANERYEFQFLLRIDDDYFVCMDRLIMELPYRPKERLYWGYIHCKPPGGIRVDEGFVIVTNDLVQEFLREQNKSLMCHPYGDQAMAMWINNIPGVTYFGDPRVHYPVSANEPILEHYSDICSNFLALHGSYPAQIEKYWTRYVSTPVKSYPIPGISYPCEDEDKRYNKDSFQGVFYADPEPCKDLPKWNIGEAYAGRGAKVL